MGFGVNSYYLNLFGYISHYHLILSNSAHIIITTFRSSLVGRGLQICVVSPVYFHTSYKTREDVIIVSKGYCCNYYTTRLHKIRLNTWAVICWVRVNMASHWSMMKITASDWLKINDLEQTTDCIMGCEDMRQLILIYSFSCSELFY